MNFIHIPKNGGSSIKKICGGKLNYYSHNIDVFENNIPNQFIVIRNPIERFISAVYYCLEVWSKEKHVQELIKNKIDTPEKWIQIWSNPNHAKFNILMDEMLNKKLKIGKKKPKYKYTYCKQSEWINNPKYIILMDNFKEELKIIYNKLGIKKKIFNNNTTEKKNNTELSEKSINFLKEFYKEDFELYEKYKNINVEERLHLQ